MNHLIVPEWPNVPNVGALITTRSGGCSEGAYASLNLGDHVGDLPERVARNRASLREYLPNEPKWLRQVHGITVADVDQLSVTVESDAALARRSGVVCGILTADCLPVLLVDRGGTVVAAAHAGWRGMQAGVLEAAVREMAVTPAELMAYLGPAIGPRHYEVGQEVRAAFVEADAEAELAFTATRTRKWLADLYLLARQRLGRAGVTQVSGGNYCTFGEPERFFSFRRDGETGRMASLIWLKGA
jgi:polyphenol oxidase